MRILIDILHPAHVHFFKHFRAEMLERGHDVLVTAREKDVAVRLLQELDIPHEVISTQRSGLLGMAGELAQRSWRLARIARDFRADVLTGIMGASIAPVGRLLRIPSVVFYDTEFATRTNRYVYPMATVVCTPDSYAAPVRGNHVTYAGYHELAYLHPNQFTPDPTKLEAFGLSQPYALIRFVSWEASHDIGMRSISLEQKRTLIETVRRHVPVVLSAEGPLPPDLESLRLQGPVADIHHVLAFADLVVGDSGTMVSEAIMLGTPAVIIWPMVGDVHTDQVSYGLLSRYPPASFDAALATVEEVLTAGPRADAHRRMLEAKIDVAAWMVEFFEKRSWE